MPRAEGTQTRVIYRTKSDDFVVLASSSHAVEKYRKDSSTPLVDVLDSYDIFVTGKHGAQGVLARASKGQIENEFGTTKDEEALQKILKEGKVEHTKMHQNYGKCDKKVYANGKVRQMIPNMHLLILDLRFPGRHLALFIEIRLGQALL